MSVRVGKPCSCTEKNWVREDWGACESDSEVPAWRSGLFKDRRAKLNARDERAMSEERNELSGLVLVAAVAQLFARTVRVQFVVV